ncbi:LysE family translocator [Pelagibius sp. Alg239-R121]|uniref:LysE family translocator n=1 Tax=Pelagibius sp. Alg239-R121 TaxID=2993448 RepID=UPI0024A6FF27|nr:LysE family translocator [Pelagibius sp. Alg239-R121]
MTFDMWLAFTAASVAFLAFPIGPTILLVITLGLSNGPRIAPVAAFGVALGDATAMTVSLAGLGALSLASAQVFAALKWIGAAYLIWLGIRTIRSARDTDTAPGVTDSRISAARIVRQCAGVTALNPKPIAFFIAFVPYFIDPAAPLLPQFAMAIATFTSLAWVNAYVYARLAGQLRGVIRRPSIIAWFKRVSGTVLIGMGLATLTLRRSSV